MIELLQRYYQCLGYYIRTSVPIPYRKKVRGSEKIFYKFLDMVAIRNNEVLLIECRSFRNVKKLKPAIERICRFYNYVDRALESLSLPIGSATPRKLMYVEDDDWHRITDYMNILKRCGIEPIRISSIIEKLVECANHERELRKTRGEGDTILSIIALLARNISNVTSSKTCEERT